MDTTRMLHTVIWVVIKYQNIISDTVKTLTLGSEYICSRDVDRISRDEKIPGLKDPGILKPRKSRDYECMKIPGFFNESWESPGGIFSPLFM